MSMQTPPTVAGSAAIDRLRSIRDADTARISHQQVARVTEGLIAAEPLVVTAAKAGLEPAEVLDLVGGFGTWLSHVEGAVQVQTSFGSTDAPPGEGMVVVPEGYEPNRRPYRRDVVRSLCTIVAHRPGDAEVARYLARRYPATSSHHVPTYSTVALVRFFAEQGRLDELDQINDDNQRLAALLVAAYELLCDYTDRANAAVMRLVRVTSDGWDDGGVPTAEIEGLLDELEWAYAERLRRLRRTLALHTQAASPTTAQGVALELGFLQQRIGTEPEDWLLRDIGEISVAGLRRLGEDAGLRLEAPGRAEVSRIRSRLRKSGLAADVDKLVDEALRARDAGVDAAFWESMERRAVGDPDWETTLNEAYRKIEGESSQD